MTDIKGRHVEMCALDEPEDGLPADPRLDEFEQADLDTWWAEVSGSIRRHNKKKGKK